MKKIPLKRRELIALLTHNGFAPGRRGGTSHVHYIGEIDGQKRIVTVDESIDEFSPDGHGVLSYIISSQLRLYGDGIGPVKAGWERFYGGEPAVAKRARVPYRRWNA